MNMEKTDMQKKVMVLACGLLCLVTTIGSAVAQNDNKAYPGSACKPTLLPVPAATLWRFSKASWRVTG